MPIDDANRRPRGTANFNSLLVRPPTLSGEGIGEDEHHRHADADEEVGVDETRQQKHPGLQRLHQLLMGLALAR